MPPSREQKSVSKSRNLIQKNPERKPTWKEISERREKRRDTSAKTKRITKQIHIFVATELKLIINTLKSKNYLWVDHKKHSTKKT